MQEDFLVTDPSPKESKMTNNFQGRDECCEWTLELADNPAMARLNSDELYLIDQKIRDAVDRAKANTAERCYKAAKNAVANAMHASAIPNVIKGVK